MSYSSGRPRGGTPAPVDSRPGWTEAEAGVGWNQRFELLAEYHRRWKASKPEEMSARNEYLRRLKAFEDDEGDILESHLSDRRDAGVALTRKRRRRVLGVRRRRNDVRLHRATVCLARELPQLGELLFRFDNLRIKARLMLRGMSRHVCLHELCAAMCHLLNELDRDPDGARRDSKTILAAGHARLDAIEGYYRKAAAREAKLVYLIGMLAGVAGLMVVGTLVGFGLSRANVAELELTGFMFCLAAGALGAFLSVLQRMSSGHFHVNHQVGREYLMLLGVFRPLVGALFGLALFFALASGSFLQASVSEDANELALFTVVAFLGGFSERFAKDLLRASQEDVLGEPPRELPSKPSVGGTGRRRDELSGLAEPRTS